MNLHGKKKFADNVTAFVRQELTETEFAGLYGASTATMVKDNFCDPVLAIIANPKPLEEKKEKVKSINNKIALFCAAFI